MTNIYRIWEISSYGKKELAFTTDPGNYIWAQVKDAQEIGAHDSTTDRWVYTNSYKKIVELAEQGYCIGEMVRYWMPTGYQAEKIIVES